MKRSKKYRPKFGNTADMAERIGARLDRIASSALPLDASAPAALELKMIQAVSGMTSGQGMIEHAITLASEISLGIVLCEANFANSREYIGLVVSARDALESAGERHVRTGVWGLSGPERTALNEFIELRVAQLSDDRNTQGIERAANERVLVDIEAGNFVRFTGEREACAA